jgi:hypothetical protein
MRAASIVTTVVLLTSCSTPEERKHHALMDQIEEEAQLPKGAASLNHYARFYADGGKGRVIAVYLLPSLIEKAAAEECEELTSVDASKNVPCVSQEVRKVKAGERRWLSNQGDLPFEVAPGCQVVTLAFDVTRRHFDELSCVGDRPVAY